MKLSNVLFLAASALCLPNQSFAGAGAHGGDTLKSTPLQVEGAFNHATEAIPSVFTEIMKELNQTGDALRITSPRLRSIFIKMVGNAKTYADTPVVKDLASTKIKRENEPGCEFIKGLNTQAAVPKNILGVDICVNRPKLESLPVEALPRQLTALMAHELSHHFGADEELATDVQRFVMYKLYADCRIEIDLKSAQDESIFDHAIVVYPRSWNFWNNDPQLNSNSTSIKVVNTSNFTHAKLEVNDGYNRDNLSEVDLETHNAANEFQMDVNKATKESRIKVMVLNKNLSRTAVEFTWKTEGGTFPIISHDPRARGSIDGRAVNADAAIVSSGCFY